ESNGDCHAPLPREVRKGNDTTPRARCPNSAAPGAGGAALAAWGTLGLLCDRAGVTPPRRQEIEFLANANIIDWNLIEVIIDPQVKNFFAHLVGPLSGNNSLINGTLQNIFATPLTLALAPPVATSRR